MESRKVGFDYKKSLLVKFAALLCLLSAVGWVIALLGGGDTPASSASVPYTVVYAANGTGQTSLDVELPAGATIDQAKGAAPSIVRAYDRGMPVMINFYSGPKSEASYLGYWRDGAFTDLRASTVATADAKPMQSP